MGDLLHTLVTWGAAALPAFWAPVAAWTGIAVIAEVAVRRTEPSPVVSLWARGSVLALLPALVVLPAPLATAVPSFMPSVDAVPFVLGGRGEDVAAEVGMAAPAVASPWEMAAGGLAALAALAAAAALVKLAGGLLWLYANRRLLEPADADLRWEARRVARRLGIRRPMDVRIAPAHTPPFTMGWRRPVVAIPQGIDRGDVELALAHEMVHVRHAHFGWHLAERAVRALFVWHPLVHGLSRGLALDRERAADSVVLAHWPDRAEAYGRLLITHASHPSPALALGASSSPLLSRLTAMAHPRSERRRLAYLIGSAVFALPLLLAASALPDAPERSAVSTLAPADTLLEHIQSVRAVPTESASRRRLELQLAPGTSRAIAAAIADYYSAGGEPGTLVVTGDGFREERATIQADAFPPPPPPPAAPEGRLEGPPTPPMPLQPPADRPAPPPPPTPATPIPPSISHDVERVSVRTDEGIARVVTVQMKAGSTLQAAEAAADHFAEGDQPGTLTVIAGTGERISRSTLNVDAVPAPPPPPVPPAPVD